MHSPREGTHSILVEHSHFRCAVLCIQCPSRAVPIGCPSRASRRFIYPATPAHHSRAPHFKSHFFRCCDTSPRQLNGAPIKVLPASCCQRFSTSLPCIWRFRNKGKSFCKRFLLSLESQTQTGQNFQILSKLIHLSLLVLTSIFMGMCRLYPSARARKCSSSGSYDLLPLKVTNRTKILSRV